MICLRHVLLFGIALTFMGCQSNPGEQYMPNVYSTSQVNQAQEVQTVDIISLQPAKIAVNPGTYGPSPYTKFVDGVQITFKLGERTLNSAQVGQLCDYKLGPAIMVSTSPVSTRVQPNNPDGCNTKGGGTPVEGNI